MMIVVTIIAIATMLGIPSYRAWVQNTQIYTAAESAANGLQKAKAEAVRQNRNVEFVLGASFPWKIQLPGSSVIETSTSEGSKNVTRKATLADGTTVGDGTGTPFSSLPATATTITFNDLGGVATTNANGTANLTQIVFDSASSATLTGIRKLQVTIGLGGITRMCDPDPNAHFVRPT